MYFHVVIYIKLINFASWYYILTKGYIKAVPDQCNKPQ